MHPSKFLIRFVVATLVSANLVWSEDQRPRPGYPEPRPAPYVPQEYRAVTLTHKTSRGQGDGCKAGSRVDVLWDSKIPGKSGSTRIVENARVLSCIEQQEITIFTLLVSSEGAARISLAATQGSISLQLRGDTDLTSSNQSVVQTVDDLRGTQNAQDPSNDCLGSVVMAGTRYCVKSGGRLVPESAQ